MSRIKMASVTGRENATEEQKKPLNKRSLSVSIRRNWQLYLMCLPGVLFMLLFAYKPMYGILVAFKDYNMRAGVWDSPWAGFENFQRLFSSYWFPVILKNTVSLSLLSLVLGFPLPIILALILNEVSHGRFRKTFQTISYAPHFISVVVLCGMVGLFLNPTTGIVNIIITRLGGESINFLQDAAMFKWVYVLSGIWQGLGWGSIIYFATLSGVDKSLLEAAEIDGANRLHKIWYINIPVLIPTIVILLILQCGSLLGVGYEKVFLLQNSTNLSGSEVISTYVYKVGLEQADFGFGTATDLFNALVNTAILLSANFIAKKTTEQGLF